MRFQLRHKSNGRRAKRVGAEAAQTLAVAAQMAMLCPSNMDVWMQRELSGGGRLDGNGVRLHR